MLCSCRSSGSVVMKCKGAVNRLVMMRGRNLAGPAFQNVGSGCMKSVGNYYSPNAGIPEGAEQVVYNGEPVTSNGVPLYYIPPGS